MCHWGKTGCTQTGKILRIKIEKLIMFKISSMDEISLNIFSLAQLWSQPGSCTKKMFVSRIDIRWFFFEGGGLAEHRASFSLIPKKNSNNIN